MCILHRWAKVENVDHSVCGYCYRRPEHLPASLRRDYPLGFCPHSFRVCVKCGKAVGYGSHGKLTVVPDGCRAQIEKMRAK